jgi:phosphopantothenate-cysteine ligase
VLFYLAAAVSDFFLPRSKTSDHKIQSSGSTLELNLEPVPKFLKRVVESWSPSSMIISFKLETDPELLLPKSRQALERYQHHLVIGNLLQNRKQEVKFVTKDAVKTLRLTDQEVKDNVEIESLIIPEVIRMHEEWINQVDNKKCTTS